MFVRININQDEYNFDFKNSESWEYEDKYMVKQGIKWTDIFEYDVEERNLVTLDGKPVYFHAQVKSNKWSSSWFVEVDDLELLYLERMKKCL